MDVSTTQVALFRNTFTGRTDVYGTYDPRTRRVWQVKRPVTDLVVRNHLEGRSPYGVYLLQEDRVCAVAADFDQEDEIPPQSFRREARKLGFSAYIERSKSKGFHGWIFFDSPGVLASKARAVVSHLLKLIHSPQTEVFPKQDRLDPTQYGNFINAPLFGPLVSQGRTVFLDDGLKPWPNQWTLLSQLHRSNDSVLDKIIAETNPRPTGAPEPMANRTSNTTGFGLPPCAQKMLSEGVVSNQRVACFRLACQLRKVGLPFDMTLAALSIWSQRNHPCDGKEIIRPEEIRGQVSAAYQARLYLSCGCEDVAVLPYCDLECSIRRRQGSRIR